MRPTITIDASEWKRAARALSETSSRSCVDFTNGQALKVAIEAIRNTERANKASIAVELGATGTELRSVKARKGQYKGQVRLKKGKLLVRQNSLAERILGKRFQLTGSFGVKQGPMEDMVRRLIAARTRAAAFIASGWITARSALFSVVRQKPSSARSYSGARRYGKPKGSAKPAAFSLRSQIVAEITNTALLTQSRPPSAGGNPMPVATAGLQKALNIAAADMRAELDRRLGRDLKQYSAR